MAYIAVITALQPRADLPAHPRASLEAGGITLLERNVRLLRKAGAATIYILTDDQFAVLAPMVSVLGKDKDIKLIDTALALTNSLADEDNVIVLDEGVLLDARLIAAVAGEEAPHSIAVFPSLAPEHERAVRIDPEYSFASILKAPGKTVRDVCRGLGDWDFVHTLLRTVAADPQAQMLAVSSLDTYAIDRRRALPILWQPMKTAGDQLTAGQRLIDAAQPHGGDWVSRYLLSPLENILVQLLLPRRVPAPALRAAALLLGLAAMLAFAFGWLWSGLAVVLALGPMLGLADKLASIRVQGAPNGYFWRGAGYLMDAGWIVGLGWYLAEKAAAPGIWGACLLILLSGLATTLQTGFFQRFTGKPLDDAGPTERLIRLFAGARQTFAWALLPFAVADLWAAGYKFIALYAGATFFLAQFRFFVRLKEYGVAASSAVAANFERAGYNDLRPRKPPTS
jgi:1L-myo-inositol 1-phosphate cytidylyltransferase / CDP-L-myo-inositol myo-inositolphosphotransferase